MGKKLGMTLGFTARHGKSIPQSPFTARLCMKLEDVLYTEEFPSYTGDYVTKPWRRHLVPPPKDLLC